MGVEPVRLERRDPQRPIPILALPMLGGGSREYSGTHSLLILDMNVDLLEWFCSTLEPQVSNLISTCRRSENGTLASDLPARIRRNNLSYLPTTSLVYPPRRGASLHSAKPTGHRSARRTWQFHSRGRTWRTMMVPFCD
jgi:hypothetical protein